MTAKPPVAIRITRPHQSEDEFLAAELDTVSRTGVVLVGAQQRPEGVVLRFELTLANGAPLLRGEGRVIGYKPNVIGNEGGLALRFTRLDSKSKGLVDRVGAMREQRRSLIPPPPQSVRPVDGAAVEAAPPPLPPPPPTPSPDPLASSGEIPVSVDVPADKPSVAQAQDRSGDRFARLRERASRISAEQAAQILADGAARRRR